MKLLSVIIPCYNSQDYMRNCIESLLLGGNDVELLIINDGSIDQTATIAEEYVKKHPSIVRAVHQENLGHGGAVNTGISQAVGQFVKVVDSDDWVDKEAYLKILHKLENYAMETSPVDLVISNFVYEKAGKKIKKVTRYTNCFPEEEIITWNKVRPFRKGQYLMMHSLIYRTALLKECNFKLPTHTFYVDNLFVYLPLQNVKRMVYINVNFYRYFIGREEQSVNEKVMIKRIDQQIKVNKLMIESIDLNNINNEALHQYFLNHLEIVTAISSTLLIRSGTKENLRKNQELWDYIRERDVALFGYLRNGFLGKVLNMPGRFGRKVCISAYKLSQMIIGFN